MKKKVARHAIENSIFNIFFKLFRNAEIIVSPHIDVEKNHVSRKRHFKFEKMERTF